MTSVDALGRRLAEVQDQLIALPDDAFFERHELLLRHDELREEAAQHSTGGDAPRPTEDLVAELRMLRRRRDTT